MAASSFAEEDRGKAWPNVKRAYELGDVIGWFFDEDNVQ